MLAWCVRLGGTVACGQRGLQVLLRAGQPTALLASCQGLGCGVGTAPSNNCNPVACKQAKCSNAQRPREKRASSFGWLSLKGNPSPTNEKTKRHWATGNEHFKSKTMTKLVWF